MSVRKLVFLDNRRFATFLIGPLGMEDTAFQHSLDCVHKMFAQLRVASKLVYREDNRHRQALELVGAGGGGRTHTERKLHGILSRMQ